MFRPLAFTGFFENYDYAMISIAAPVIYRGLGVGASQFGAAVAVIRLASLGAVPVLRLADRLGRRRVLLVSLIVFTTSVGLTAVAWSLAAFLAFQIPARIFLTTEGALASLVIAEEVRADRRGRAMSALGFIAQTGFGFAALLIPLVPHTPLGWRLFYVVALAPLLVVAQLRRNVPETRAFTTATAEARVAGSWFPRIERRWWRRVGVSALFFAIGGAILTPAFYYASALAQDTFRWTSTFTIIVLASGISTLGGFVLGGRGSDRWGRLPMMRLGSCMGLAGVVVLFTEARSAYPLGWFMMSFGQAAIAAIYLTYVSELVPTEIRATVTSFIVSCSVVGGSAGLAVAAVVIPEHLSAASLMRLLALVGVGAISLTGLLPETAGADVVSAYD